ncbi:MAG: response regulator, partial [Deltaproteobacteria bacterium]|nr:response regulator [Deltaproteobacteria bacterium]
EPAEAEEGPGSAAPAEAEEGPVSAEPADAEEGQASAEPADAEEGQASFEPDDAEKALISFEPDDAEKAQVSFEPDDAEEGQASAEPDDAEKAQVSAEPDEAEEGQVSAEPDEAEEGRASAEPDEAEEDQASDGPDEAEELPVAFLARFEPLGWTVGVSDRQSEHDERLKAEQLQWARDVPLYSGASLLILSQEGEILLHSDPELEGVNVLVDDHGTGLGQAAAAMIAAAENRSRDFFRLALREENGGPLVERAAYFRDVPQWGWVAVVLVDATRIGTEMAARQETLRVAQRRQITRALAITAAMLALIAFMSRLVSNRASEGFSVFIDFFEKAASSAVELDPSEQHFLEFARLAEAANHMIRERQVVERRLKESEFKFRTVFEVSPQIVTILDLDGHVLEANDELERYINVPPEQVLGRRLLGDVLGLEGDVAAEIHDQIIATGLVSGKEGAAFDSRGRPVYLLFFAKRMAVSDQERILGVCVDITDRKLAELEKLELQEKLSRSQKMEAIGLMAAEVAHELNNILSGVIGWPQLLLQETGFTEQQRSALNEIMDTGRRAAAVVGDLLTLSKGVASAKVNVDLADMAAKSLASDTVVAARAGLSRPVEVKTAFESPATVKGSPVHLKKVMMNLLLHALESAARNPAGGRVAASVRKVALDENPGGIERFSPGEYVALEVTDNGAGLSAEEIRRIFEPFSADRISGSGLGLGMAVVDLSVREHGGAVKVSSSASGTTYTAFFPAVASSSSSAAKTAGEALRLKGQGQKILVVDDVDIQRKLAVKMLGKLGYEAASAASAASGEEAIERLKQADFELVILDMIMTPGINGRETYETILTFKPEQKAIIASGMAETEEVEKAQALGASHFVSKPYTLEDIAWAVHRALDPEPV